METINFFIVFYCIPDLLSGQSPSIGFLLGIYLLTLITTLQLIHLLLICVLVIDPVVLPQNVFLGDKHFHKPAPWVLKGLEEITMVSVV